MYKSVEYEQEYTNLRSKVEDNIQNLQNRLSFNYQQKRKIASTEYKKSPPCNHHHHCHMHCQHAHYFTNPALNAGRSFNYMDMTSSKQIIPSQRHIHSKINYKNEQIKDMLSQNLRNQKQINDNIKIINQRILTFSTQRDPSILSSALVQNIQKRTKTPLVKELHYDDKNKYRCKSQMKDHDRDSQECIGPLERNTIRKVKKKVSELQSHPSERLYLHHKGKSKNTKIKSKSKPANEYLLSFGCPIHSPNKISLKDIHKKQIYKDSEYRNRKHEKNHLLNSFQQQERSRRRLLSKIASEVFSEYGKR